MRIDHAALFFRDFPPFVFGGEVKGWIKLLNEWIDVGDTIYPFLF